MPIHRRTATKVRDGRVLKKHNWRLDPGDYRALPQDEIRLDRRRPPDGSRHLITIAELRRFLALLPDWDEVAVGLDAIVLDSATDCAGWCGAGVVGDLRLGARSLRLVVGRDGRRAPPHPRPARGRAGADRDLG